MTYDAIFSALDSDLEAGRLTEDEHADLVAELEAEANAREDEATRTDSATLALKAIANMGDGDAAQQIALAKTIARVTLKGAALQPIARPCPDCGRPAGHERTADCIG